MSNSIIAADKFMELLTAGKMHKAILPNNSPNYTGGDEKKDLMRYRDYLNSFGYDDLRDCEVRVYNGDEL